MAKELRYGEEARRLLQSGVDQLTEADDPVLALVEIRSRHAGRTAFAVDNGNGSRYCLTGTGIILSTRRRCVQTPPEARMPAHVARRGVRLAAFAPLVLAVHAAGTHSCETVGQDADEMGFETRADIDL